MTAALSEVIAPEAVEARRRSRAVFCVAPVLAVVFLWAYWTTLTDIVVQWFGNPDYSHAFLVAPLSLYFLWLRRDEAPRGVSMSWLGLFPLVAALLLRAAAGLFFVKSAEGWAILPWAAGVALLLGGWRWLVFCWPSIAFLFFMVPLPYRVSHWLSSPLQSTATIISTWTLQCLGQPALAEGNTILLGIHQLEVERACSGLRIFMGILAIAFACVMLTRRPWWQRCLTICSALPIALVANSARIVATGLLYRYASTEAGKVFSHDISGWLMIPLAACLFAAVVWYLDRLMPDRPDPELAVLVARQRALQPSDPETRDGARRGVNLRESQ